MIEASHSPAGELWNWMVLQSCPESTQGIQAFVPPHLSLDVGCPRRGRTLGYAAVFSRGLGDQLWTDSSQWPRQVRERTPQAWRGYQVVHNSIHCAPCIESYLFIPDNGNYLSLYCYLWSSLFTLQSLGPFVPNYCFGRPHMKWVCLVCCFKPGNGSPFHENHSAKAFEEFFMLQPPPVNVCFPWAFCTVVWICSCHIPSAHFQAN